MLNHATHQQPILAAVLLDPSDDNVIGSARYLARKLRAPLHLVHAIRPAFNYASAGDLVINPYYGFEVDFNDSAEKAARLKLERLQAAFDDVDIVTHLVRDFPSEAITALAEEIDAGLIVSGVDTEDSSGGFLSGTSTGHILASEAKIPVLLIPHAEGIRFEGPLRLLVADNLEVEGLFALESAVLLANELHAESLVHLHVKEMSLSDIDRMIGSVRESMILGQLPSDPGLNREHYLEKVKARAQKELLRRYESKTKGLNSTRYESLVEFGKPSTEIHSEVERSNAQLIVFGRHHLLHTKSFSLGRIPYKAMAKRGVAALVVPDHKSPAKNADTERREDILSVGQERDRFLNQFHA